MKNQKSATIENRKAKHEYFIEETLECGIELRGNEVKSLRCGMASIKEAWITIEHGEMIIKQFHITKWDTSNNFDVDTTRDKRILAHKKEIKYFYNKIKLKGYTLVPLKIYFKDNHNCKVLVGLCKGKHLYDKRESAKNSDMKRQSDRAIKGDY